MLNLTVAVGSEIGDRYNPNDILQLSVEDIKQLEAKIKTEMLAIFKDDFEYWAADSGHSIEDEYEFICWYEFILTYYDSESWHEVFKIWWPNAYCEGE